ncbi:brachyurin-like isoform X2 [Neocloeon triangulifer]|uniref:brachyurin-like isoform X2 n=1 Tax=Neocloeon triangulifer TaxID=2078957 RepID=UPI00286F5B60|nr:brachyurin-like isoform X2 [Neocloeon triangulifer]
MTRLLIISSLLALLCFSWSNGAKRSIGFVPNNESPAGRIIGGENAVEGQLKYQVGIRMDDSYFCGGSLIADQVVLTAGHCVKDFVSFEVHLGALNFNNESEVGRVIVTSYNATLHENYNGLIINNDIALVNLPDPVFGPNISPVRLPSWSMANETFANQTGRVSGWGKPSDNATSISPDLKFADVTIITNEACQAWYGELVLNDKKICISTNNGTENICSGDSGGPLVIYEEDGLPTEIGINSFVTSFGCESRFPGGLTRVTSFLGWLETNAGITLRP